MSKTESATTKVFLYILAIIGALILFDRIIPSPKERAIEYDMPPPPPYGKMVKGIDYSIQGTTQYRYYTDDEVRAMRNANPNLIIKIPGRTILSKEDQFERDLEEYLEYNPEILEDYLDEREE